MASTFPTPYNRNRLAIQIILPCRQLTNTLSKVTNAVLRARVGRLGAALATGPALQEPWPFALNATQANPEGEEGDDPPAR